MKLVVSILALTLLAVSIMPCADMGSCEDMLETQIEDCQDHSEEDHEGCTPFCICQCCGTSMTIPAFVKLSEPSKDVDFTYLFHYSFNYSRDYSIGIWHPPSSNLV